MEILPVREAVGTVLGHDMTEIIPGEVKHAPFKKGHVIREEDIPRLLRMGKEHVYIMKIEKGELHEDDAAIRISNASAGEGVKLTSPREGKVNFKAECPGLLKVNWQALARINEIEQIIFSTAHDNLLVKEGELIAGTKVVPLVINEGKIEEVERICEESGPIVRVKPLQKLSAGIVITGNEVYSGRIEDKFEPLLKKKFEKLGCSVKGCLFSMDNPDMIAGCITRLIEEGADIVAVTGGMSVDPDDVTPTGIRRAGAHIESYGAPVMPGVMFLLSYIGDIPVVGLPGAVLYHRATIFDVVMPRIISGERLTRKSLTALGHGGLCKNCSECRFPDCGFGKGGLF